MPVSRGDHFIWRNSQNGDVIDWQLSNGQIASVTDIGTAPLFDQIVGTHGDFNGDGHTDLLFRDLTSSTSTILETNGDQIVGVWCLCSITKRCTSAKRPFRLQWRRAQ